MVFYGKKLDEDGKADLTIFLLDLVHKGKAISQRYCAVALRNEYIRLSKKEVSRKTDSAEYIENCHARTCDIDRKLDLQKAFEVLTEKQKTIIALRYIYGFTINEIADKYRVTRQATNQALKRALDKLKSLV